jgi:hypothetical protein
MGHYESPVPITAKAVVISRRGCTHAEADLVLRISDERMCGPLRIAASFHVLPFRSRLIRVVRNGSALESLSRDLRLDDILLVCSIFGSRSPGFRSIQAYGSEISSQPYIDQPPTNSGTLPPLFPQPPDSHLDHVTGEEISRWLKNFT